MGRETNITGAIGTGHKLSLEKRDVVGDGGLPSAITSQQNAPTGSQHSLYYPCPGPMGGQALLLPLGLALGQLWAICGV